MSINKRYAVLIKLLKEWLNEESDHNLKQWGEMRDHRSRKIKSAIAPRMNITKKPEIDRILEEAEAHMPKKPSKIQHIETLGLPRQHEGFISSVNKDRLVSLLWEAYEANLESLKVLVGEDARIKIAKERISSCIEDWRLDNDIE